MNFRSSIATILLLGTMPGSGSRAAAPAEAEFFEQKIRPVLVEQCYECHSAESKALKGGLRLDDRAGLLQGGDTGPAVVPGKPGASLLLKAMRHGDPDVAMPPKKPRLPEVVLVDFERWIADGVTWPTGEPAAASAEVFDVTTRKQARPWIWEPPRRQSIPAVTNTAWPLSPVDHFILHRLEQKGLAPAAPVDDRTWLRRVYFAITGLPPSREDLREFLSDRSPDARERVVDRLLASPHYGERWARHWMDLVRYAETRGHEADYHIANAWQYRDYLIRAFNAGVPYDQFLLEHLAGDVLPQPRMQPGSDRNESVLGTGWAFLGEENHSPVDIRQDECDRLDNKLDVFTKTFLGLTVSCARCHDHKFDPIRTQDYYALTGFLLGSSYRQVRFEAMENNHRMAVELAAIRAHFLPKLAEEIGASRRAGILGIQAHLLAAGELLSRGQTNVASEIAKPARKESLDPDRLQLWLAQLNAAATNPARPLHGFVKLARRGGVAAAPAGDTNCISGSDGLPSNARVIADFTQPGRQPWKVDGEAFGTGPLRPGDLAPGSTITNPIARVMTYGAARRDLFWNRLSTAPGNENDAGKLAATSRSGQMLATPTFTLGEGRLHYLIKGRTRVYAAVDSHLMVDGPLHGQLIQQFDTGAATEPQWVTHDLSAYPGHRTHLEFGPDGDGELEVLMVVEGAEKPSWKPATAPILAGAEVLSAAKFAAGFQKMAAAACDWLAQPSPAGAPEPILRVADWLVQNPALFSAAPEASLRQLAEEIRRAEDNLAQRVQWQSHTAVAWFDGTGVDEYVLVRGKPFKNGPLAPRSLPVAFAAAQPICPSASSGRYELGLQLVDSENPLVARVLVNRVWHHLFGRGLVPTVDNFGALGEPATHPELLDQLAWQFVHEDGWSMKRLIKRLVLTQTYSMSHRAADPQADELDPANNLWHRVPIRRLEAEAIRDALLAVSGRLNPAVAGPPVPLYLTEFVVGRGRPEKSGPLDGDGRRSVYTAVRRNFLPTTMLAFDSPTPFSTVGRRNVTNVPAQGLVLMNDPLFHEQARVWAQRLLNELPAADAATRIAWLFEGAYARPPTPAESTECLGALEELRQFHSVDGNRLELWTDLCHALLNANEFIYVM